MTQLLKSTALTIAVASIVAGLPLKAVAQDARIAVVNTQELTLGSEEGKVAGEKLQKRLEVIRTEMDKLRKGIDDKENSLRTRERLLSAAAKSALAKDIDDDKKVFERKAQDYEQEMNEMQATLVAPITDKVRNELGAFVKEKGYTLVIDLAAENPNIVWANPRNNITQDVLVRLNDSFKRSGGAPAAAPAPAPKPGATTPPATTTPPQTPRPTTPPAAPPAK